MNKRNVHFLKKFLYIDYVQADSILREGQDSELRSLDQLVLRDFTVVAAATHCPKALRPFE